MSGDSSRVKSLWLMPESGGFATIADATGATALFVPAELDDGMFPKDARPLIPRHFATGRNKETAAKPGVARGTLGCKPYASGYTSSVSTAGNAPPTRQWFDYVLESLFGTAVSHNAGVVGASPSTTTLPTTTSLTVGELVALYGASTNGGRVQWARVGSGSTPYALSPTLAAVSTAGDILYASRTYSPKVGTNATSLLGSTLSWVEDVDGLQYVIAGSRPSKLGLRATAGQAVMWDLEVAGDSRVQQAFGSLPAAPTTDPEPMILRLNPINLGGTLYDVASVEIDFGITLAEVRASGGANARSGWRVVQTRPRIKIDPLNLASFEGLYSGATLSELLIQFGDGSLVNSHLNSIAFHAEQVQIMEAPNEVADNGIIRKSLVLAPVDAGATGASAFYWQLGVC